MDTPLCQTQLELIRLCCVYSLSSLHPWPCPHHSCLNEGGFSIWVVEVMNSWFVRQCSVGWWGYTFIRIKIGLGLKKENVCQVSYVTQKLDNNSCHIWNGKYYSVKNTKPGPLGFLSAVHYINIHSDKLKCGLKHELLLKYEFR